MQMRKWGKSIPAVVVFLLGFLLARILADVISAKLLGNWPVFEYLLYAVISIGLCVAAFWLAGKVEGRRLGDYGVAFGAADAGKLVLGLIVGSAAFCLVCLPMYLSGAYVLDVGKYTAYDVIVELLFYIEVGFMEEYLCRGFLQHRMLRWGAIPSLVITAAVFSLLHLANPGVSILAIFNLFLAGVFIGSVMYATGSLYAAIGVHITWNWVQGSILGIPVSGGGSGGYFITTFNSESDTITGGAFGAEASISCAIILLILSAALLTYSHRSGKLAEFRKKGNSSGV